MIWVTWRQHRIEGLAAVVILALIIPCILVTGFTIASAYQDMGMAACIAQHALCLGIRNAFVERFLGMIITWWSGPWNAVRGPWETYNLQGMVPVASAIFALMLGIAVGLLVRRSVPAMAITLVICGLLPVAVAGLVRPHLLPPLSQTWRYDQPAPPDAALGNLPVGSPILLDRQGYQLSNDDLGQICQPPLDRFNSEALQAFAQCEADHGVHYLEFYQPANRFWVFQGMETGLFLLL